MFKFLVPVLFLSTSSVYASVDNSPTKQNTIPKIESKVTLPTGKCSIDLDNIKAVLHDNGYEVLLLSHDKFHPEVMREVMFNNETDEIIFVSLFFNQIPTGEKDKDADLKVNKICLEYVGTEPLGDGPEFKKFILHQHIDGRKNAEDQHEQMKKEHLEKEHDPYQGPGFNAKILN